MNLVVERKVREGDKEKTVQVTVPKRAYLILLTNEPPTPSGTTMPAGKDLVDISQENASLLGLEPRRKFVLTPEVPDESIPDKTQYVQAGDVVVKVDGIADPTWNEINDYLAEHKRETTELDVLRDGKARKVKLYVPWQKNYFELLLALGFDDLNPIVADVIENTPAAKLKLPRGARIIACGDKKVATWFDLVDGMKTRAGKDFTIAFEHGGKMQSGALSVPKNWRWEDNVSYAIDFYTQPMMVMIKGQTPQEAIALGIRQTWNMIKMVYVTIQRVAFTQTIGVKQLSGPIFIIHMGKRALAGGFNKLLYYLALISANLAVINFLPIPVVDGGLILVLLLEKLRGRPMSPRSTAIWQATGLALIIGLFVLVTYNDILRLIRGGQ